MNYQQKMFINMVISAGLNNDLFSFSYKNGKGHFSIYPFDIMSMKNNEFKKFCSIVAIADDSLMVAGYINSMIRTVYNDMLKSCKEIVPKDLEDEKLKSALTDYAMKMIKFHDILAKFVEVEDLVKPVKEEVQVHDTIDTSNEIMTELKRCNVHKLIPTQTNPVWKNCKLDLRIGYQFNYRGMDLQLITDKGWVTEYTHCKIYVIDPVIGLPITSYEGTVKDLEEKLSEVFIGYLKTIESNKEFIVQVAKTFKELKLKANVA